jgi:hypothetical protein
MPADVRSIWFMPNRDDEALDGLRALLPADTATKSAGAGKPVAIKAVAR